MKPHRSPEHTPSTDAHEQPRWPWENPSEPETEKTEPEQSKLNQKKHSETQKDKREKLLNKKHEQQLDESREKNEKEQNKHERRATLLEQSLALTKQFEEAPIPNDPRTVARIIIAKRVVAVNEQLEAPPADRSESDEDKLFATLDYLGDLSEKFEDPDSEASPEIEEAYESILLLASDILKEEDPEVLIEQLDSVEPTDPETPDNEPLPDTSTPTLASTSIQQPAAEKPKHHRIDIASLPAKTILLLRLLLPKRRKASVETSQPTPSIHEHGNDTPPSLSKDHYTSKDITASSVPRMTAEHAKTDHTPAAPFHHQPKHERLSGRSLPVVAPIILGALALGSRSASPSAAEIHQPITVSPEDSHYHGPSPEVHPIRPEQVHKPNHTKEVRPVHHDFPSAEAIAQPLHELRKTTTSPEVVHASLSAQKFEFMSLHSLLDAARNVPVGHGEYLHRAYEKGHVDKAGLISILKANAKGRDFIAEYRHQANRTRQLKMTSPEFLRTQPKTSNSAPTMKRPPEEAPSPNYTDSIKSSDQTTPIQTPLSSPEKIHQTLDMLKTDKKPSWQTWPTEPHPMRGVWIIIGVIATAAIALITVFILTLF